MINDYDVTQPMNTDAGNAGSRGESMGNDEVISTLNNLIETSRDGQEGFREAAEGVERSDLKTFFNACSLERAGFVGELQGLVRELGGEPADDGSFAGAIHRGWIDIKSAIAGRDDEAILAECERGEDSAKSNYNDALRQGLPENVRRVVETQAVSVRDKHDRIKALRDFTSDHGRSSTESTTDHVPNTGYDTARQGLS